MTTHMTVDGISQGPDGWYGAVCECGFSAQGYPDIETIVDVLMEHVSLAVQIEFTK